MTTASRRSLGAALVLGVFAMLYLLPTGLHATEAGHALGSSVCPPSAVSPPSPGSGPPAQEDEPENHIDCSGNGITATASEDDGLVTLEICVTDGTCSGTWGGADIEIEGEGKVCVRLKFSPE